MSVLIPNMDKPKSCNPEKGKGLKHCPMVDDNCDCILQTARYDTWYEQYQHCPLIEVKERGQE